MSEPKGIIFKGEMIRAILDGRKTMTRRPIKFCLNEYHEIGNPRRLLGDWPLSKISRFKDGLLSYEYQSDVDDSKYSEIKCPYGQPGDRLWVRETWRIASINHSTEYQFYTVQFKEGFGVLPHPQPDKSLFFPLIVKDNLVLGETGIAFGKWRPSIFMPRWASRILLEIVNVKVERLQDICEEDAHKEGILNRPCEIGPIGEFADLWESIYGPGSWELNPWVWVIEFERIK